VTGWRLPRQTGNWAADVAALQVAWSTASTDEQLAACRLRTSQLVERSGPMLDAVREAFRPLVEVVLQVARAWADIVRDVFGPTLTQADVTRWPVDGVEREAALAARRARGAGPAPRRLDGRRARR
jgi:hypothetical protein